MNSRVRKTMFCRRDLTGLVSLDPSLNVSLTGLRYFFTYLLPHQAPPRLTHLVDHIMNSTGEDGTHLDVINY